MLTEQINSILTQILERNSQPIILVTYKKRDYEQRFCGKYKGWLAEDGWLWLHNEGKVPISIFSNEILALEELTEKDLIKNLNSLFRIVETVKQTVC